MSEKTTVNENGKLIFIGEKGRRVIGNSIIPIVQQTNLDTAAISIFLEFFVENKRRIYSITRDKIDKYGIKNLTKYGADSWNDVAL